MTDTAWLRVSRLGCDLAALGSITDEAKFWRDEMAEDARTLWARLSSSQRRLLIAAAAAELSLKITALIDIKRRPADRIRGPKAMWRAAMAVNLIGPVSYFVVGRKRAS
jgi:hypothetical protein